jgi:hypothetical protein
VCFSVTEDIPPVAFSADSSEPQTPARVRRPFLKGLVKLHLPPCSENERNQDATGMGFQTMGERGLFHEQPFLCDPPVFRGLPGEIRFQDFMYDSRLARR